MERRTFYSLSASGTIKEIYIAGTDPDVNKVITAKSSLVEAESNVLNKCMSNLWAYDHEYGAYSHNAKFEPNLGLPAANGHVLLGSPGGERHWGISGVAGGVEVDPVQYHTDVAISSSWAALHEHPQNPDGLDYELLLPSIASSDSNVTRVLASGTDDIKFWINKETTPCLQDELCYLGHPVPEFTLLTYLGDWRHFIYTSWYVYTHYRKTDDGLVIIEGSAYNINGLDGTVMFNLPAGYRPSRDLVFLTCPASIQGWDINIKFRSTSAHLHIDTNGNVYLSNINGLEWQTALLNTQIYIDFSAAIFYAG